MHVTQCTSASDAVYFCESRRQRRDMYVQTSSRSDKNIADAKLERTSLSADVFKRSDRTYLSSAGWKSRKRVCDEIYNAHNAYSYI